MVLPLLKLGTLALRTLSKPIAARIKKEAGRHPKFRSLIINFAQANHRMTTTMQRRIYGHATNVEIRPLNEERAVQVAVDLMGELFVFLVAVAAVIFEVQRSARSEAKKEEQRRQDFGKMCYEIVRQRDEKLEKENQELRKEVVLLMQKVGEIEEMARRQGLTGAFNFRHAKGGEAKPSPAA
ncbi:hypothetical protein OROMI_022281 [Orobanche minor]